MVWAGQDTTSRQLGRALITFAQHPEQWRLLASEPELLLTAVNEILRWTPQARMIQRFAKEDVTYQGLNIAEGSPVFCSVASAGRAPLAMPRARTLRPPRSTPGKTARLRRRHPPLPRSRTRPPGDQRGPHRALRPSRPQRHPHLATTRRDPRA
ncbi:hypothetical protein ACFY2N_26010 [Streptomyces rubiginosohelvolus]|uniref:hypothetical protein n=1 Tax=Streptomyces rubiginosohelvolus TaxID=67362 RepID=UPI0036C24750